MIYELLAYDNMSIYHKPTWNFLDSSCVWIGNK